MTTTESETGGNVPACDNDDVLGGRSLYEVLGGREALQRALYGMGRD